MKLLGALILVLSLSAACGLQCYVCLFSDSPSCTEIFTCPAGMDRCFSVTINGTVSKSCINSASCVSPMSCCEGNLCNSAIPTEPSAIPTGPSAIPTGPSAIPTGPSAIPTGPSAIPTGPSAIPTGPSAMLLLVSSAIITIFL
ncbi:ly-6/neurotoxin-like protein 1 [Oreochromis aureus]|uniref:UPAR/Ly6 domain-containing protein n=1 Tax=Oreochromis aureus TaxID=47969 RepID=A0AAZ1Y0N1_OREAU|nr:ly-6/neurotoxin-like protein 1 [Oreochromis aureus]